MADRFTGVRTICSWNPAASSFWQGLNNLKHHTLCQSCLRFGLKSIMRFYCAKDKCLYDARKWSLLSNQIYKTRKNLNWSKQFSMTQIIYLASLAARSCLASPSKMAAVSKLSSCFSLRCSRLSFASSNCRFLSLPNLSSWSRRARRRASFSSSNWDWKWKRVLRWEMTCERLWGYRGRVTKQE